MNFNEMKNTILKMQQDNHVDFVKAIISIEKGVDDEKALDTLYNKFMDDDTMDLLDENFNYLIDEMKENGEIRENQAKDSEFTAEQMAEIEKGYAFSTSMYNIKINVDEYKDPKISAEDMKKLRKLLQDMEEEKITIAFDEDNHGEDLAIMEAKFNKIKAKYSSIEEQVNIVGKLASDVKIEQVKGRNGQDFTVANFSVYTKDENGKKTYHNISAYGDKVEAVKDYQKYDFVRIEGLKRHSVGSNGKEYTNIKLNSTKLLKANTQRKESTLGKLEKYKEQVAKEKVKPNEKLGNKKKYREI